MYKFDGDIYACDSVKFDFRVLFTSSTNDNPMTEEVVIQTYQSYCMQTDKYSLVVIIFGGIKRGWLTEVSNC